MNQNKHLKINFGHLPGANELKQNLKIHYGVTVEV